ncbi:DUF6118 family protein [Sphingomonadaceae bacterium jetA1]|jgi:hypothetical protein|uniref:DUF6118 family protein n=1 Tax=Facivitalis istanbulensis TaxID=3075838 RepID=UPI003498B272
MDDDTPTRSAAEAFDAMSERLALLTRAVQGLAAEKERAPDYTETLGQIAVRLDQHRDAINTLAKRPAMTLTVTTIAEQIVEAANEDRKADAMTIRDARDGLDAATAEIARLSRTARTADEQTRHVRWLVGYAVAGTILAMMIVPGMVARSLPAGWLLPERMTARMLRLDRWQAGERLLATADPERWQGVVAADRIVQDNRDAIIACRTAAAKLRKSPRLVTCPIRIGTDHPYTQLP